MEFILILVRYSPDAALEMQYKLATFLRTLIFDEHVANELPWLLMRIIQSPHSADSSLAQTELSEVLLDFSHFSVIGKVDTLKYDHWTNLKLKDPKWNLGPLYSERALHYVTQVNERIAQADPGDVPTIKYEASAILLTVSQTLRLSSAQGDARTIGALALSVFLQIPSNEPIVEEILDIDKVLLDEDNLNKASKYHESFSSTSLFSHPHLTNFLSNLGDILRNLGKLEQAGGCYKRTLIIRTEQFGDHHADVATSLNLVGNIARETGKLDEASEYYKKSLAIREELFGENNLIVAALLNDLGILQCNQKKLEDGKATHQRALAIRTALLGARHPNVANSWNNLGTIFRDQGFFEEGLRCYHNALSIRREQFGEIHPHVGFSLNNLGILLLQKGELEEAAATHRQALKIRTELFGEKHPDVVVSLNNLGAVLKQQGKEDEASECTEKAKSIKASL